MNIRHFQLIFSLLSHLSEHISTPFGFGECPGASLVGFILQEAKYVESGPARLLPGLAGTDLIFQWIGMVEYILCYGGPAEHWGPLPATRLICRKILIGQLSKSGQGQHSVYSVFILILFQPKHDPNTHLILHTGGLNWRPHCTKCTSVF
jgi:hypothetical protein